METITKQELIALGYSAWQSAELIRQAKKRMVSKGYSYYNGKKVGIVPVSAIEEILGFTMQKKEEISHGYYQKG